MEKALRPLYGCESVIQRGGSVLRLQLDADVHRVKPHTTMGHGAFKIKEKMNIEIKKIKHPVM